jgi:hypothetical protein
MDDLATDCGAVFESSVLRWYAAMIGSATSSRPRCRTLPALLRRLVALVTGIPSGVIAIDGKSVRRSAQKGRGAAPIHMVSAFAAGQRLVLGQVKVAEKPNEIIAIAKLLNTLAIEGAIVTIDAIGRGWPKVRSGIA